jgi:hypothetical protein
MPGLFSRWDFANFCLGWLQATILLSLPSEQLGLQACKTTPSKMQLILKGFYYLHLLIRRLICWVGQNLLSKQLPLLLVLTFIYSFSKF